MTVYTALDVVYTGAIIKSAVSWKRFLGVNIYDIICFDTYISIHFHCCSVVIMDVFMYYIMDVSLCYLLWLLFYYFNISNEQNAKIL